MSRRDALATQFEALKQTSEMSVNEYNIQFTRLSRYAPRLVDDDAMRTKRFIRGLIDLLFKPLASYLTKNDITYAHEMDVAREVEARWIKEKVVKAQNNRTKTTGSFRGGIGTNRGT
nr:uncharacterized protein LOC117277798 [Nicotiana tomentosiformis]